jgi:hypothetical protein
MDLLRRKTTVGKQQRIFISYSRINKDFALKLAKELKSEGFSVWLDILDIPLGVPWDNEVEKALVACEIFMIILTPASISSENVKDEIGYAINHRKRILPVLLENCAVPLRLSRLQYADFTGMNFNDGILSLQPLLKGLVEDEEMSADGKNKVDFTVPDQKKSVGVDTNQLTEQTTSPRLEGNWLEAGWKRGLIAFGIGTVLVVLVLALGQDLVYVDAYVLGQLGICLLIFTAAGFIFYPHKISYIMCIIFVIISFSLMWDETLLTYNDKYFVAGVTLDIVASAFLGFILSAIVSRVLHIMKVA